MNTPIFLAQEKFWLEHFDISNFFSSQKLAELRQP